MIPIFRQAPFVILNPDAPPNLEAKNVLVLALRDSAGNARPVVPVYSSRELAESLVEPSVSGEEPAVCPLNGRDSLRSLLAQLRDIGVQYVCFDFDPSRPNPIPIQEAIGDLGVPLITK